MTIDGSSGRSGATAALDDEPAATDHDRLGSDDPGDPLRELSEELIALEAALSAWDLDGIARHEAAARSALGRARAAKPGSEQLLELMSLTRRCMRLSDDGASVSGALTRVGRLTYSAQAADTQAKGTATPTPKRDGHDARANLVGETATDTHGTD